MSFSFGYILLLTHTRPILDFVLGVGDGILKYWNQDFLWCILDGTAFAPYDGTEFGRSVFIFDFRPAVAISMAFFLFQLLLAKYVFLVDKDTTLALDNRYVNMSGAPLKAVWFPFGVGRANEQFDSWNKLRYVDSTRKMFDISTITLEYSIFI